MAHACSALEPHQPLAQARSWTTSRRPSRNDEYLLYQTLLGTWPLEPPDDAALAAYRERIEAYMLKAVREAKLRTSWSRSNAEYEEALTQFVRRVLEHREGNLFLTDLAAFAGAASHGSGS